MCAIGTPWGWVFLFVWARNATAQGDLVANDLHESSEEFDLVTALGARDDILSQRFSIYLPNMGKDASGLDIEIPRGELDRFVNEAKTILGKLNQGATVYPECDGIWWKRGSAEPTHEKTRVVYSFIDPTAFREGLPQIREFLHRFGRETGQQQVFVEFDSLALRIENYD